METPRPYKDAKPRYPYRFQPKILYPLNFSIAALAFFPSLSSADHFSVLREVPFSLPYVSSASRPTNHILSGPSAPTPGHRCPLHSRVIPTIEPVKATFKGSVWWMTAANWRLGLSSSLGYPYQRWRWGTLTC